MFQPERLATIGFAARRRPNGLIASVMWLAGMIAALRARGMPAFEAASAGVWLHGRAAERAGPAMIADDLLAAGSMLKAKEAGRVRMEGKDYVMQDGDVVEFRFSV